MSLVTVLCVTQSHREAVKLAVDSLRHHNRDVPFSVWVWSNDCTDGTKEWAADNCDRVFHKTENMGHMHGVPLDRMTQQVGTPYVLIIDNDTYTTAPFLSQMIAALEAAGAHSFAACGPMRDDMGTVDHFGRMLQGQRRIDPACALFRANPLGRMTTRVTFSPYESVAKGAFYDTGGMITAAAEGAGYSIAQCPWLWDRIRHFGCLTWANNAPEGSKTRKIGERRLEEILAASKEFYAAVPQNREIVVAKYREDVSWTRDLPYKVTVYDKSDNQLSGSMALRNVGREGHTYAHHVAENYDDLADVTVFTQGAPFDHVPGFLEDVKTPVTRFTAYGKHTLESFADGDVNHPGLPLAKTFFELTNRRMPDKVMFRPGAIFAATREVLHRYPRSWWRRLRDHLAAPETQNHGPWVLERLFKELLVGEGMSHIFDRAIGWFSAENIYRDAVRGAADGDLFVECGAYHGKSTMFMAVEIINSGKRILFDVVDTFRGSNAPNEQFMRDEAAAGGGTFRATFDKNVEPVKHVLNVRETTTTEAAKTYTDESLSFVFLDACHDEASVTEDIAAYLPKIKPGGVLAGDDYVGTWPGVVAAVNKAFGGDVDLSVPNCWIWRKRQ